MARPLSEAATRLAGRVDRNEFEWLGIANTMRLSKRINRIRRGAAERHRRRLFDDSFDRLLDEAGGLDHDPGEIRDGYLLDTSLRLPHLDRLIEACEEVIAERGGRPHPGREKPFIVDLREDRDLVDHPALLDFVLSPSVLAVAARHLRQCPLLSRTRPPGVRVVESSSRHDPGAGGPYRGSQLYHLDLHDRPLVYVIVLIRDVTVQSGPFTFLPASVSDRVAKATGYQRRGAPYRLTDEEVHRHAAPDEEVVTALPKGTVLFIDSSRCLHHGSRDCVVPRYQAMYAFTSPCRTDLSEQIMPAKSYPVREDDPTLRRLALDVDHRAVVDG